MTSGPDLLRERRDNLASRGVSLARLNGQVYTPDDLAGQVVASLPLRPGARVLDPACGDGAFLRAVADRCRREGRGGVHLEGWDVDAAALALARAAVPGAALHHRDALDARPAPFDLVVGNPPYLEAKRMPDALKRRVRAVAPAAARGAFDLYGAFVELGVRWLAPGGTLALVVPNRLLVTGYAAALRALLLEAGRVEIVDLSTHGAFGDAAAVYPVVLRLDAGGRGYGVRALGGGEALEVDAGAVGRLGILPLPAPGVPGRLLARVLGAGLPRLGDAYEVRWTVSFHRAGLRDRYVAPERPASPWARRFLGGGRFAGNREVAPYRIAWAGTWIDHDEARARADANPLPPLALFEQPKVAICQNARRARAALDTTGLVLKDTFLAALPRAPDPTALPWLVLALHSDVFHVLYEQLFGGTRKGGAYLHFLGRYLDVVPLPPCPDPARAVALHDALAAGEDRRREAEALVRAAYGVTAEEGAWLDAAALPPH